MVLSAALLVVGFLLWPGRLGLSAERAALRGGGSTGEIEAQGNSEVLARLREIARTDPVQWWRRRRAVCERGGRALLEVLALLRGALGAGLPTDQAFAVVASGSGAWQRDWPALRDLVHECSAALRDGRPIDEMWRRAGRGGAWQDSMSLVASLWALSQQTGTPVAETIGIAHDAVRSRLEAQRRVRIAVAGAQSTMTVLTVLPLAGPLLGMATGVPPAQLYAAPLGPVCIAAGLGLVLVGRSVARRMIRGALEVREP